MGFSSVFNSVFSSIMKKGAKRSSAGLPQTLSLSSSSARPLNSFGWTAATISSTAPGATFALTNSAGGQFSIGGSGNALRLEKLLGSAGTQYTITIQASAPGYATTSQSFTLTVANTITAGLVERINALNLSNLFQDSGFTNPVTSNGQTVDGLVGSIAGWQFTSTTGPTYVASAQNGLAGLGFTGTQFLNCLASGGINFFGSSWLNTPWTIIMVLAPTNFSNAYDVMGWGSGSANYLTLRMTTSGQAYYMLGSGGSTSSDNGTGVLTAAQAGIMSWSSDGSPDTLHLMPQVNGVYGYSNANTNPTSEVSSTYTSGTLAATAFTIGKRAYSTTVQLKGNLLDVLIYNRQIGPIEMEYIHEQLAAQWGITLSVPSPTYIDKTKYTLGWNDDFDGSAVNWTPTQGLAGSTTLGSDGNPTGWVPALFSGTSAKTLYGSPPATAGENEWFADPRNSAFAANGAGGIYTVANSALTLQTMATPSALSSNCGSKPYLSGGLITNGWQFGQFGYVEARIKMSHTQLGNWPAWWMMPANGVWYAEIDIMEGFDAHGATTMWSTLHSIPYPDVNTTQVSVGNVTTISTTDDDFHVYGCKWDETGIGFYFDGRLVSTAPAWGGVRKVTVTNPGSGLTNGTYTLYMATPTGAATATAAKLQLVVSGGTVTSATVLTSGSALTGQPTWYTNSGLTTLLSTTLPGVALTVDISSDPPTPMFYYEPFYLLLHQQLGGSAGTFSPTNGYPSMQIDYVRWYTLNRSVPATMTPGYSPSFDTQVSNAVSAITTYWSNQGVTMSGSDQSALSTFIRTLMSYQLRFDTTPPTDITSSWNTANLSLWSAMDGLWEPGLCFNVANQSSAKYLAKMNLVSPGTGDMFENGSGITYTPSTGLYLPGTSGTYLANGVNANQWNNADNHFSLFLPAAPTNSSLACLMGFASNAAWLGSSTAQQGSFGSTSSATQISSYQGMSRAPVGSMVAAKGYKHGVHIYQNGSPQLSGYHAFAQAFGTWTGGMKIGSYDGSTAGAQFSFLGASQGRRLSQEEVAVLNSARRTLYAALGITLTV